MLRPPKNQVCARWRKRKRRAVTTDVFSYVSLSPEKSCIVSEGLVHQTFVTDLHQTCGLEPTQPGIPIPVEGLVAKQGLYGARALQIKAGIKLIGHADAAMNLDQLV